MNVKLNMFHHGRDMKLFWLGRLINISKELSHLVNRTFMNAWFSLCFKSILEGFDQEFDLFFFHSWCNCLHCLALVFCFFKKINHSNQAFIFKTKKRLIEPSNPNRYHATHTTHEYTKIDKFVVETFFIVLMLLKVPKKMKLSAKGLGNSPPNKGL